MGTVGSSGKYLVTDMPVASQAHTPGIQLTFSAGGIREPNFETQFGIGGGSSGRRRTIELHFV
jgi:hypothetical protein